MNSGIQKFLSLFNHNKEVKDFIIEKDVTKYLVRDFLEIAGKSLDFFRYYNTRDLNSVYNHVITIFEYNESGIPIGYGHLDKNVKDNTIWLGICVAEEFIGRGLGKTIMKRLMDAAKDSFISSVFLSVDESNTAAKLLYTGNGFVCTEIVDGTCYYKWEKSNV